MGKIKVIKVEPGKEAYVSEDFDSSRDNIRSYIGGPMECISLDRNTYIICNEHGNIDCLTPNRGLKGSDGYDLLDVICGNFLIVGVNIKGVFVSISESSCMRYLGMFRCPERLLIDGNKFKMIKCKDGTKV